MNMACERTEVGVRRKMSFVVALTDVRETTNRFFQCRCGNNVVPISWFYDNLLVFSQYLNRAREPKDHDLCDIARYALVFDIYLAQFL